MKKAFILLLAFVMIVSAGMGCSAAAETNAGDATTVQSGESSIAEPDNKEIDPCEENKEEATIIIIKETIVYKQVLAAAGAAGAASSAAAAKKAAAQRAAAQRTAGAQSIPMQKTGLPILPAVLSTLMIGSGLLYGKLRK